MGSKYIGKSYRIWNANKYEKKKKYLITSKIDKTSLNISIKIETEIPAIKSEEEKEEIKDNLDEKDLH